jgi:DnaJ family protein B protein 4
VTLGCTIFEFYNGSIKKIDYTRQVLEPDGRSIRNQDESMTIEVKPGYDTDTVLTFSSKGHEAYALKQSALVIRFSLEPTETNYVRKGDNLVYTHSMTLEDALVTKPVQVRTLDGRYINFCLDNMATPQSVHTIAGEGMPRKENNAVKGDLQIKFNIEFPKSLKSEYKQ